MPVSIRNTLPKRARIRPSRCGVWPTTSRLAFHRPSSAATGACSTASSAVGVAAVPQRPLAGQQRPAGDLQDVARFLHQGDVDALEVGRFALGLGVGQDGRRPAHLGRGHRQRVLEAEPRPGQLRIHQALQEAIEALDLALGRGVELVHRGGGLRRRAGVHEDAAADLHGDRPARAATGRRRRADRGPGGTRCSPEHRPSATSPGCACRRAASRWAGCGPGPRSAPWYSLQPRSRVLAESASAKAAQISGVASRKSPSRFMTSWLPRTCATMPFGLRRLALERHHQVEDLAHLGAAVGQVAGLHQRRGAAGPAPSGVDETGRLQDRGQAREAAMDVADGDDPRRRVAAGAAGPPRWRRRPPPPPVRCG